MVAFYKYTCEVTSQMLKILHRIKKIIVTALGMQTPLDILIHD
jgi:hypothetical protein